MAKVNTVELEVWVVVDENGDYSTGNDGDQAAERYGEEIGGDQGTIGLRRVKLTITVPLPAPIELTAEVSAEETAGMVTVG